MNHKISIIMFNCVSIFYICYDHIITYSSSAAYPIELQKKNSLINYIVFKQKIRQQRKEGLLIIYPWSTNFKENFNEEKDKYIF